MTRTIRKLDPWSSKNYAIISGGPIVKSRNVCDLLKHIVESAKGSARDLKLKQGSWRCLKTATTNTGKDDSYIQYHYHFNFVEYEIRLKNTSVAPDALLLESRCY